jgi:hypothetical protein
MAADEGQTSQTARPRPRAWPALVLATVIFAALSLWGAITSEGFLEADSCTHYLYARFAVGELHYLVNVWGRPLVTGIYAIPAALAGRVGVRVMSLCLALGIALVAYRIAKRLGYRWPALAFIFVLAQPLVFLHSFSELTELPFAFFLALAFWAYVARRWLTMTVLVALLPLARPEGFLFILLAGVALLAHRKGWWIALLPVPLLVWDWAGWEVYGRPAYRNDPLWNALPAWLHWVLWLKHEWPYAEQSAYARGHLLHFVATLPAIVGPLVFPAVLIGIWQSLCAGEEEDVNTETQRHGEEKSGEEKKESSHTFPLCLCVSVFKFFRLDHQSRCRVLVGILPLMVLVAHSILYWRGKMASNGELRYMLTVALFWGLLAAAGWEWIFTRLRWKHAILVAGVAALLPAGVQFLYPVLPLRLSSDWEQVREAAHWYTGSTTAKAYPRLLVSNPAFFYFMDVSPNDRGRMLEWRKETVAKCPPGTLLVWDHDYAMFNSDRNRIVTVEEILNAGWIEDEEAENQFAGGGERWKVFRSRMSMVPER